MSISKNKYISLYRDTELEAFYDVEPKYKRKIIFAHMMIHLLPVIIGILFYYVLFDTRFLAVAAGLALLFYVIVILETVFYLYPRSREIYKKFYPWFLAVIAILSGFAGYRASIMFFLPEFQESVDGVTFPALMGYLAVQLLMFVWAYIGLSHVFIASRTLYTRKASVEADVRFAREVQERLLQEVSVATGESRAYACSLPANELGGDFFELSVRGESLFASVGDVSGHSFGAGLLMAVTKSALQTHLAYQSQPSRIISELNKMFKRQSDRAMFATAVVLKVDMQHRKALLSNAGHMPVFHVNGSTGDLTHRYLKGIGLGMKADTAYPEIEFEVEKGDMLVLYSDGLVEIRDESGQIRNPEFFEKVVRECLLSDDEVPGPMERPGPKEYAGRIIRKVKRMHHGERMEDDATLIIIGI